MSFGPLAAQSAPSQSLSPNSTSATYPRTSLAPSPSAVQDAMPSASSPLYNPIEQPSALHTLHQQQPDGDTRSAVDGDPESNENVDVDPQIVEALKSAKDRLYVLKLGEQMEALILERNYRTRVDLMPETTYQRLLVHRCAAYYKLAPENEPLTRGISVLVTMESSLPVRRLSDLVPAEEIAHPTFKIMRRSEQDRKRSKATHSQAGSVAGEDGDLSDREPSESGSLGSRSTTSKKRMTIAEREAAYQEARSRIFMGFEDKEKAKERDASASSSTLSLVSGSGSASGGGGSSMDGNEDSGSAVPNESEWSGPVAREAMDNRRGGGSGMSSSGSARSLRSSSSSYNGHGPGGGSGTSSPAFSFPSLHEPAPPSAGYDMAQGFGPQYPGGYMAPYPMYPYPSPGQGPTQPFLPPYPYYLQFPFHHQQHPSHHPSSDPSSPASAPADMYHPPHPQNVPYPNQYMWPHPTPPFPHPGHPQSSPPVQGPHPPQGQGQHGQHGHSSSHTAPPAHYQTPPYPPFIPGHHQYGQYPIPPYYPPPQQPPPPTHSHSQPMYPVEPPQANGGSGVHDINNGYSNGVHGRSPRNGNGQAPGGKRSSAPAARAAWSYGPGVSMGGMSPVYGGASGSGYPFGQGGGETVGPRLSSSMRRTSGASTGSGSGGNRTPGDETASTTSSSTSSSSSRRTFLSTSSKHPLPARPDWAAGLKPHPTLHPTPQSHNRHRDSNSSSRNMSPAPPPMLLPHSPQQQPQQLPPIFLQATDFPPLSMSSAAEKRPVVGGAWTNPSPVRSVLPLNPGQTDHTLGHTYGTALVHHQAANGSASTRLDEHDRSFERPPPKGGAELFNPKAAANGTKRPAPTQDKTEKERVEKERARGEAVANAILVERVASLRLQDPHGATGEDGVRGDVNIVPTTPPIAKDTSTGAGVGVSAGASGGAS